MTPPTGVRSRVVNNLWIRNPNGPPIMHPPPYGTRMPNGHVWGNSVDDFYWVQRNPQFPGYMGLASRSMLDQFGENYRGVNGKADPNAPPPRVVEPHPVLSVTGMTGDPGVKGLSLDEKLKRMPKPDPAKPVMLSLAAQKDETDDISDTMSVVSSAASAMNVDDPRVDQPSGGSKGKGKGKEEETNPFKTGSAEASTKVHQHTARFESIPRLEEFIPEYYYPDILLVHDPYDISRGTNSRSKEEGSPVPKRYKRVWPVFDTDDEYEKHSRTASMWLDPRSLLGTGHHSFVYRAPFELPSPLRSTHSTGKVTVAAKLGMPGNLARELLANEARIYNGMEKHMQEDWSGLNVVSPIRYPVPVCALAPKFFGWFEPIGEDAETHERHREKYEVPTRSPILLLEECGEPIEPKLFTIDQRTECFAMFLRVFAADILQNSPYTRNVMRQPGPLHLPPAERSNDTPSFRIIDFGRGQTYTDRLKNAKVERERKGEKPVDDLSGVEQDKWYKLQDQRMSMEKAMAEHWIHQELGYGGEYDY